MAVLEHASLPGKTGDRAKKWGRNRGSAPGLTTIAGAARCAPEPPGSADSADAAL